MRIFKKSKIPNAMITDCKVYYDGSITIGRDFMKRYNILPDEQVHVLGVNTKERAITYAIAGDDGVICCNGGLANIFWVGDIVNIVSYEILP